MKIAIAFVFAILLVMSLDTVEGQRNRQYPNRRNQIRGGTGGRGSGGPSGVRFPTEDEERVIRGGGPQRAGRWPGGFYGGSNW